MRSAIFRVRCLPVSCAAKPRVSEGTTLPKVRASKVSSRVGRDAAAAAALAWKQEETRSKGAEDGETLCDVALRRSYLDELSGRSLFLLRLLRLLRSGDGDPAASCPRFSVLGGIFILVQRARTYRERCCAGLIQRLLSMAQCVSKFSSADQASTSSTSSLAPPRRRRLRRGAFQRSHATGRLLLRNPRAEMLKVRYPACLSSLLVLRSGVGVCG